MAVIIAKLGIIPADKQTELKEAGYIVIEVEDAGDIVIMDESPSLDGNMLLDAALKALDHGNSEAARLAFGNIVRKKLMDKKVNPITS